MHDFQKDHIGCDSNETSVSNRFHYVITVALSVITDCLICTEQSIYAFLT